MPGDPRPLTKLQRIMRLGYSMTEEDERRVAEAIFKQRRDAWRRGIEEQAARLGVRRHARAPSGRDLDDLRRMSYEDARSVRRTYNAALERAIRDISDDNPRGNRHYYAGRLEQWHEQRSEWKDRQIALYTQKTARHHAQQRFQELNGAFGQTYRFTGPAPVCEDCAAMFAAGVVDQQTVDFNPTPLHPNCPHEWKVIGFKTDLGPDEIWMG